MTPVRFQEANVVQTAPKDMDNCVDVHACKTTSEGRPVIVTAWRPSNEELVKINLGEPVYLVVWGEAMQPACVTVDNPFEQ